MVSTRLIEIYPVFEKPLMIGSSWASGVIDGGLGFASEGSITEILFNHLGSSNDLTLPRYLSEEGASFNIYTDSLAGFFYLGYNEDLREPYDKHVTLPSIVARNGTSPLVVSELSESSCICMPNMLVREMSLNFNEREGIIQSENGILELIDQVEPSIVFMDVGREDILSYALNGASGVIGDTDLTSIDATSISVIDEQLSELF